MKRITIFIALFVAVLVVGDSYAQQRPYPPASWGVTQWYVNAATGNDQLNSGVTFGAPVQTLGELYARLQTTDPVISTVTITVEGPLPSTDPLRMKPTTLPGGLGLTIQGVPSTIGTGTLAGVVPKNRPAGQELEADLGASVASYVGQRICNTPRASCAKVSKIISGHVARISQPVASDNQTEVDSWANGDAFTVSGLPTVYVDRVKDITLNNVTIVGSAFNTAWMSFCAVTDSALGAATVLEGSDATSVFNTTDEAAAAGGGGFVIRDYGELESGVAHSPIMIGGGWNIGTDIEVTFEAQFYASNGVGGATQIFLDPGTYVHTVGLVTLVDGDVTGIYGNGYQFDVDYATVIYDTAATTFLGTGNVLSIFNTSFATTCDLAHAPKQCISGVPLSVANLDSSYPTGFAGSAKADTLSDIGFRKFNLPPVSTTPYIVPIGGGGTANDAGCADGAVWVGTGVTTPNACDPTLPVGSGGLGRELCDAGTLPQSDGTKYVCVAPSSAGVSCPINLATCTTGQLPVSSLAPCSNTQILQTVGGVQTCVASSSVLPTLTNHDIVVGAGTTTPAFLAPGTSGNVAKSNGTDWTSVPDPAASCPINLGSCTSGLLPLANLTPGTNFQGLFSSGGTATWQTITGDITPSNIQPGVLFVSQLKGQPLPDPVGSGTNTFLTWNVGGSNLLSWGTTVPSSYVTPGSANSILFTNAGASGTTWAAVGGDLGIGIGGPGTFLVNDLKGRPLPDASGASTALMWNIAGSGALSWTVPQAPLFNASQAVPLSSLGTFFTLATITDTAAAVGSTYTISATVSCSDPNDSLITYGLSLNSTTALFWGHTAGAKGDVEGIANGSLNYSAVFTGTSVIRLLAKNTQGTTAHCDGDLVIVRSP